MNSPPVVCLFFQAHQPFRTQSYDFFQIGSNPNYFDDKKNQLLLNDVCKQSYLPALQLFEKLHQKTGGQFSFGLSLSGTLLTQLERWRPDVLARFKNAVDLGVAVLTGGMMTHSISSFFSAQETARQIQNHRRLIFDYFGVRPTVFANTELIYRDDMVKTIQSFGYDTILAEGIQRYLGHRSPDYLYHAVDSPAVRLLLRNSDLSDDLGLRFSDRNWDAFPLTPDKFLNWVTAETAPIRNLFMGLESIGAYHPKESGIFDFWENLILGAHALGIRVHSPASVVNALEPCEGYSAPKHSSWAGVEKDKSAWQANVMQQEASQKLFRLQQLVESSNSKELFDHWSNLQSAEHFTAMSTQHAVDSAPYENYSYFMNILADLQIRSKVQMAQQILHNSEGLL